MAKGDPIPIRFEAGDAELLQKLEAQSGLKGPEIVRRAVRLFFQHASKYGLATLISETANQPESHDEQIQEVPDYSDNLVEAGLPTGAMSDNPPTPRMIPRSLPFPVDFVATIRGDSMEGVVNDGEVAAFTAASSARSGQVVLVIVNGVGLIKLFEVESGKPRLVSVNPNYDPIPYDHKEMPIRGIFQGCITAAQ